MTAVDYLADQTTDMVELLQTAIDSGLLTVVQVDAAKVALQALSKLGQSLT